MHRRSERLSNKRTQSVGYFSFTPELDFATINPMAYHSKINNETHTFREMMKQPGSSDFVSAINKETSNHELNDRWEIVPRKAIGNKKVLKSIWAFKRKRDPDGSLNKHKARICPHGGMQRWGVDFWETHSLVASWLTTRLMFVFCASGKLESISLDFDQAFTQAKIKSDVCMEIPLGYKNPGNEYVLKLKTNFYGLTDGNLTLHEHCTKGLIDRGFTRSNVDPCLFCKRDLVLILCVDDCCIFGTSKEKINEFVESLKRPESKKEKEAHQLKDKGFDFAVESSIEKFLGAEVSQRGNIATLRQPHLIERIIETVGFHNKQVHSKPTPSTNILHRDEDGEDRKEDWNCRSAIGMLNYLANATRPDAIVAAHQCARHCENPRLSHEKAVKRIAKYLIGTQHIGTQAAIDVGLGLQAHADADFANAWNKLNPDDASALFSRTGYAMHHMRMPIVWCSKIQSRIALSSTEAECAALSTCLRDVMPIMSLISEISSHIKVPSLKLIIKCRLFEDNESCIKVAKAPILTPRTKHIALEYHHFRWHVDHRFAMLESIRTGEQTADLLTKPVPDPQRSYLRKKLNGH